MHRGLLLTLIFSGLLSGCTTWQIATPAPNDSTPTTAWHMRVTTHLGTFDVYNARLYPDSVVGNLKNSLHFAVPIDQVLKTELPERDTDKTHAATMGAGVAVGVAFAVVMLLATGAMMTF